MSLKQFIFWYVSRKCVPARKSATIKLVHNWESENMRFLEVNVVACSLLKNEFSNSANKTQSPKRLFQDLFRSVSSEVTTLFRRITAECKLERPDDNIPHTRNWKFSRFLQFIEGSLQWPHIFCCFFFFFFSGWGVGGRGASKTSSRGKRWIILYPF